MAVLYTPEDIQRVLRELRIQPIDGLITTREAADILTWRAKAEHKIDFEYGVSAVRRHIQLGNLKPNPGKGRLNHYKPEDVFLVPLAPRRGLRQTHESVPEAA